MAKKTTKSVAAKPKAAKPKPKAAPRKAKAADPKKPKTAKPRSAKQESPTAADALIKLIESPLVADLLAVGATAALAAIAEARFGRKTDGGGGTKRALKSAGKAAAAAMGRRLATEVEEIRKASKKPSAPSKA